VQRHGHLACLTIALALLLAPSSALAAPPVYQSSFGSFATGNPQALAVDQASGDLYAIDASEGTVSRFDAAGNPKNFSAGPDAGTNTLTGFFFDSPSAAQVAIDDSGGATDGDIYLTNNFGGGVEVFANDGTHLGTLDGSGNTNPDSGGEVCGVAVAPGGDLYVGYFSGHIDRYVPSGSPVENADFDSEINEVGSVCNVAASDSTVYASTWTFEPPRGPLTSYPTSIFPGGGGSFGASSSGTEVDAVSDAVSLDPGSGNVYVDEGNKISVFDSTGSPLFSFGSESDFGSDSDGVAVTGASGTAYVADRTNGEIDVFAPGSGPTVPAPTVTSVSPDKGPTAGGQTVTITGTDLEGATEVKFGNSLATIGTDTATEIVVESPPHPEGTVDVTVTTPYGTSTTSAADEYTYVEAPMVTGVSPNKGATAGGNTVTVTGANLQEATFKFGPGPATGVAVNGGGTSATMTVPAGAAGAVDVRATAAGGESANTGADDYTYVAPPTVTGLSPDQGPTAGGNTVEIAGTDLAETTKVEFGSTSVPCPSAQCAIESDSLLDVTAPPHTAGAVHVTLTTPYGTSTNTAADDYTFSFLPFVIAVEPAQGPIAGGNTVKIAGVNLSGASEVEIGGNVISAPFAANTATKIEFTAPAHAAGTVAVTIATPGGESPATTTAHYTYQAPAPPPPPAPPTPGSTPNPPPAQPSLQCVVPKLKGMSPAKARSALAKADCKTGQVSRPKPKKGRKFGQLVVKSSKPGTGTALPAGAEVDLTLGSKPRRTA
jgi:IPT/TIG domain/PASTA domain